MELTLTNLPDETSGLGSVISVSDRVFTAPFNEPLIHQAVTAYLLGSYQSQKSVKNRAQVRGSTAKPWRQKGTGRARAGSVKSPLWRGGGVTFAHPSSHAVKLNRKMYQGALRSILSELIRQERLLVTERFFLEAPKTGVLKKTLNALNLDKVLIVLEGRTSSVNGEIAPEVMAVFRASDNLPKVLVLEASKVDPVSLVRFDKVIFTTAALKQLEERLL